MPQTCLAPRGSASRRSCRRDAGASSLDDMTSRGRAARSRTRSRTPCRVIQDRRQTTTVAVDPVNSPALPGWVQSVHTSHQVVLVGGLMGCLRCGSIVAARPFTLRKRCAGRYKPSASLAQRWERLGRGILPGSHKTWPDELAAPRDVRPVDRLRHTGSEWVLDSQVTVSVFTAGSDDCRDRLEPGVSWDPYFSPARVE